VFESLFLIGELQFKSSFEQDLMILASAARSVSIHLVLATPTPER
jgi:hypothetical protein